MNYKNLSALLEARARQSEQGVLFVRSSKEETFLSYADLYQEAKKVLKYLQDQRLQPGDYLVFQVPSQKDFVLAFWACILGGIVPVPLLIGSNDEHRLKLFNSWKILEGKGFLLTDSTRFGWLEKYARQAGMDDTLAEMESRKVDLAHLYEATEAGLLYDSQPDDLAFIQFSSGSTGQPKGVLMTHQSLLYNTRSLGLAYQSQGQTERVYSWMPLTHDMGLIGFHLTPVMFDWFHGIMSTDLFIRRPYIWLNKVSEHQITITSSPNFGYEYVTRLFDAEKYKNLDLSSVRIILNGAEPISRKLCEAFEEKFASYQLAKNVVLPGYGLAEGTLTVSVSEPGQKIQSDDLDPDQMLINHTIKRLENPDDRSINVTCCGTPAADVEVRIAGEGDEVLPDDTIGEIQLNGPAATGGYLNNAAATKELKTADGWTRTGDLGYLREGKLYITGRKKDIIFVNGSNLYPHDLERVLTEIPELVLGKVIVTSIRKTGDNQDTVLVFIHQRNPKPLKFAQLGLKVKKKINELFRVQVGEVLPVNQIPKTTSGKLQRYKLAQAYRQGDFTDISLQIEVAAKTLEELEEAFVPSGEIEKKVTTFWKKILEVDSISVDDKFFELGGDSLKAAELATLIIEEFQLGNEITTNTILEHPTITALVQLIETKINEGAKKPLVREEIEIENSPEKEVTYTETDVAVIGMAIRFPGAKNIEEFWDNLKNGVESITSFSQEELLESGLTFEEIERDTFINRSGVLDEADCFDASFFGYTPQEANRMSPQMRVYHECVWSSLENAGYNPEKYTGKIGLFTGASSNLVWDTSHFLQSKNDAEEFQSFIYNTDYTSTRVSYKLNLKGPSFTFNTACSSSLVAIQLAYRSILNGESDLAIGGGVSVFGKLGYEYQEGMIMSQDGHCRAFDAQAEGTIRGSGVGVVVLKKMSQALADKDHIYAVLKGAAINNDGGDKMDYTAPSVEGQKDVIRQAQQIADVKPEAISYVEAHGTGTKLGDPVEINALREAFSAEQKNYCAIGSVKTNFGHLELAAGVAGFVKTVLMLKNRTLVPSLHFQQANPRLQLEHSPFYVSTETKEWKFGDGPLLAGVSSFGIGGTNAHAILQEPPLLKIEPKEENTTQLVVLSARNAPALETQKRNLQAYLQSHPETDLSALAYSLQTGRKIHAHKLAVLTNSLSQLQTQLDPENTDFQDLWTYQSAKERREVVFLFPGSGTQYVNLGRDLYEKVPYFQQEVNRCLDILGADWTERILQNLFPASSLAHDQCRESLRQMDLMHPVVFIIEYALARLLMYWGIQPQVMVGHSLGEYAAACIAGVFSLEDALNIVVERGRLMESVAEGVMMTVKLPVEKLQAILPEDVSLAGVNTPELCVVSGQKQAITQFASDLSTQKIEHKTLHISRACHSYMMDPIIQEFEDCVNQIQLHAPTIPITATSKGTWLNTQDATNPKYWAEQIRDAVQFEKSLGVVFQRTEKRVFLEVGGGKALSTFARAHKQKAPADRVLQLLRHPKEEVSDWAFLLGKLAQLYLLDIAIDWEKFWDHQSVQKIPLPTYPFTRTKYKTLSGFSKNKELSGLGGSAESTLQKKPVEDWFYHMSWQEKPLLSTTGDSTQNILVLVPATETAPAVILEKIKRAGHTAKVVFIDNQSESLGTDQDRVDWTKQESIQQYVDNLKATNWQPDQVLFGGLFSTEELLLTTAQEKYFYDLIKIVEALKNTFATAEICWKIIGNQLFPAFSTSPKAEKSLVIGLAKTIPQEYPHFSTRMIEIPYTQMSEALSSRLGTQILAEKAEAQQCAPAVIYFNERRWEASYQQLESTPSTPTILRTQGIYLISGGLGKVGFILAQYLVEKYRAKLILTGRSAIDINASDEKSVALLEKISLLKKLGGEVQYHAVDITDEAAMQALLAKVETQWGAINGVIHAAGILSENTFELLENLENSRTDLQQQINAKIAGAKVLDTILQNHQLDFCTVTSSISTVLGGRGFATYSAVNAYLNTLVHNLGQHGLPWSAFNWDIWKTGLGEIDLAIKDQEGGLAFDRALALTPFTRSLVISVADLPLRIERAYQIADDETAAGSNESTTGADRPDLLTPYQPPQSALEKELVAIWQEAIGYNQIGVQDDFFELGANSLKLVAVKARINQQFQINIPIKVLFSQSNVAQLAKYIEGAEKVEVDEITKVESQTYYPVSPSQKRFYLLQQWEPSETVYNMPQFIPLKKLTRKEQWQAIFDEIARVHEAFRTSFHLVDKVLMQKIHEDHTIQVEEITVPLQELEATRAELIQAFDLSQHSLFRVRLVKVEETGEQYLFMDAHHILFDGISLRKLIRDIYAAYEGNTLAVPALTYKDFAAWENSAAQIKLRQKQEAYWLEKFRTPPALLELPTDAKRPREHTHAGGNHRFTLDAELTRALKNWSKEREATPFMLLLSIYYLLLYRITGQTDLTLGTPVAGRRGNTKLQDVIGVFLNSLALRVAINPQDSFEDYFVQVKQTVLEAFDHQDYPFDNLVEQLSITRDPGRHPMLDVFFVMQNHADDLSKNYLFEEANLYVEANEKTKFDLCLTVLELEDTLQLTFGYYAEIFSETTIIRFAQMFEQIARSILSESKQHLGTLEVLNSVQKDKILAFSQYANQYETPTETLLSIFADQVQQTPDHPALSYRGVVRTYQELDAVSNAVAHFLEREHQLQLEDFVALEMPRTDWAIIAILGIMKAGGAYVPIDPNYPEERKAFLREDSQCKLVFDETLLQAFQGQQTNYPATPVAIEVRPSNLAYMVYTSGTTGLPKGAMIEHGSIINTIRVKIKNFKITPASKVIQLFSLSFDASVADIFQALLAGAELAVISEEEKSAPDRFVEYMNRVGITVATLPPVYLQNVAIKDLSKLQVLATGGDAAILQDVKDFVQFGDFVNCYGPTETSICGSMCIIEKGEPVPDYEALPIGRPIDNVEVYILDENRQLLAPGIKGELCIGGAGLARGYWNRPELTQEKFIPHPFKTGARLYRTGDLAKWLPDGYIAFVGRVDDQVKIRGYRIELSEIKAVLSNCNLVRQSVVTAKADEHGNKRLVAYLVAEEEFDKEAILDYLKSSLPDYMVPYILVEMEELPLNANGKIDKEALPEPDIAALMSREYVAPRYELESQLAEIWTRMMNVERVGVFDNFFELGGHSLRATQIIFAIQEELGMPLSMKQLFDRPTIQSLASFLQKTQAKNELPLIEKRTSSTDPTPLSYAQERLWFLDQLNGSTHYHMPFVQHFGAGLNPEILEEALRMVVDRHKALRTVIRQKEELCYQETLLVKDWKLERKKITKKTDLPEIFRESIQKPFALANDFPIRATLIQRGNKDFFLLLVMHHIASDGWSIKVLLDEVAQIYQAKVQGEKVSLRPLPLQYADYALWQRNYLREAILEEKMQYWENRLRGISPLNLPLDFKRPNIQSQRGQAIRFKLDEALNTDLYQLCRQTSVTPFLLLLTAFKILLSRYSGQQDISVGTPVRNREQAPLEQLIGFFANTLVLRTNLSGNPSFRTYC